MRRVVVLMLLILVAGCRDGTASTTSASPSAVTTPAVTTSTLPPVVECPGVGEFDEGGGIADIPSDGSDSRNIGRIAWEQSDQCETFHFDFVTSEGAPATTPPTLRVDHLESFQVIRVSLDTEGSVVSDQLVETGLVERLYVVRALSGDTFVDLHLAEPAAARASVSSSPARLTVELRPGFVPFTGMSTVGENVVLTSPAGTEVAPGVQLLGYARTDTGDVTALATQDDEVVADTTAATADTTGDWGEYRVQLDLPPGPVSVFVGEDRPEGGLQGITVDLTVS